MHLAHIYEGSEHSAFVMGIGGRALWGPSRGYGGLFARRGVHPGTTVRCFYRGAQQRLSEVWSRGFLKAATASVEGGF